MFAIEDDFYIWKNQIDVGENDLLRESVHTGKCTALGGHR